MPSSPPDSSDSPPPSREHSDSDPGVVVAAPRASVRLNVVLFVLTIVSVVFTGAIMDPLPMKNPIAWMHAAQYAGALLGILVAHESGHYIAARIHKVDASPPFFIPLPLIGFGTMGAVIRMKGRIATRKALLDIGASGPLCGLLVAFPLYAWGVRHSELVSLDNTEYGQLGSSLIVRAIDHYCAPNIPEGYDVLLSPVAFGAWAGMLITMINLLPVGQLDGGHVAYALFGPQQDKLARTFHRALLAFFFVSVLGYVIRDVRSGVGWSQFGQRVGDSMFWLAWYQVLAILGTVTRRGEAKPDEESIPILTRVIVTLGLVGLASVGREANKAIVWIGFFVGLGFVIAMEVRSGTLRTHKLFDHPPTGTEKLGFGRMAVAVLTLAMFIALFMPTPMSM
jgi:membrane-associated protease RseP (regulator of RpoE activity)